MLKKLKIYYIFVSLPFVMLLIGSAVFFDAIKSTISRNPHPQINYTIFVIILVGGVIILFNARRLMREAKTLADFSRAIHAKSDLATLRERTNAYSGDLACITQMVASSGDRSISHQEQAALEHELANVRSRLNRRNALPQYLTGLLVGMGLLGTFIGLLATLNDISILITSFADLDMAAVNPIEVFSTMITRMKAPMQSMAIAFSASMFGLLGSIILGLMMVGLRRLQNDIFAVLSSEVARHIETALSFESLSFKGRDLAAGAGDLSTEILLRIEERLAEAGRLRQRALSAEIDDFKKQRGDMLRALTEQTEANNGFRGELRQLGSQLGAVFNFLEKENGETSTRISELAVNLAGDARKTHKLLAMQVEEQKGLKDTLDSYNIEERLAETARLQQRALSAEIDDFKKQRGDMLRALTEQTEASNNFHAELQQLGGQLGVISNFVEQGSGELANRISELTVHVAADARQSHILLNSANNSFRSELQELGRQLGGQLGAISSTMEQGNGELANRISELTGHMAADARESQELLDKTSNNFRDELRQLGSQLGTILNAAEKGSGEIRTQISQLTEYMAADARQSQELLDNASSNFRDELRQLGSQLGTILNAAEKGSGEIRTQISELLVQMTAAVKESHHLLDNASTDFRDELRQLGSQLSSIFNVTEKGSDEIRSQISQLMIHLAAYTSEPPKLPAVTEE
jgi:septation ring formation regulator EzrA